MLATRGLIKMKNNHSEYSDLMRARLVGGKTAMTAALLLGSALVWSSKESPPLAASVAVATILVAGFTLVAGRAAGQQFALRGFLAARGCGALGGIATLLSAAVVAALSGAVWG